MTGKERVLAVINREPADRLPVDFMATEGMERKLADALADGDALELRKKLGTDIFRVFPRVKNAPLGEYYAHLLVKKAGEDRFTDNWGVTWQKAAMESGDVFYDVVDYPLKHAESVKDIEAFAWPDPARDWDFSKMAEEASVFPDLAVSSSISAVFDDAWRMRGIDRFLMDLALDPPFARALLRKVCDYWCAFARLVLESARIDLMWMSDDLGTQNGPLISREMCREYVVPLIRERAGLFKSHGARVVMHSCGGIFPLIPDIIEAGVEVLNPIQPRARGMDRRAIKQAFGDRLVFHGSVDQQKTLVFGAPDDVRQEVRECVETLGRGGGYIISPSHALETDIPVENVTALYEAAMEYGRVC